MALYSSLLAVTLSMMLLNPVFADANVGAQ
jgi:hypothetical protein